VVKTDLCDSLGYEHGRLKIEGTLEKPHTTVIWGFFVCSTKNGALHRPKY